jgi:hypothetical protein
MSINGIGNYQIAATIQYAGQSASAIESDGDADRSRITAPTNAAGKTGLFTAAISQTLFQIGVTPAAANVATGAAPTNTQQQALNSFAQNLFGALQPAGTGKPSNTANGKAAASAKREAQDADSDDSANEASNVGGSPVSPANLSGGQLPGSIGSNLENRLQALIQQVGSGSGAPQPETSDQSVAALQQSYQGLLASQGAGSAAPSLTSFLQALAQNMQDVPPTGNLLNITA